MRNMIEHPTDERYLKVLDFRLLASGEIALPSVEIVRPGEETETATITWLMTQVAENLVSASELLMAHLCAANVQGFPGLPVQVVELPLEQRGNKLQRIYYGCLHGDQLVRIG